MKGIVAAGHDATAEAACEVLRAGGNAFDGAVAALLAASAAEPLLASLGGGGFLLAAPKQGMPVVYDFFAQTPTQRNPDEEIYPIIGDFGDAQQEFHIGMGAMAVPGTISGLFAVHRDLGRMPFAEVAAPAIALARDGVEINRFQAFIAQILTPIVESTTTLRAVFSPGGDAIIQTGDVQHNPELADFIEALVAEGPDAFYQGETATRIEALSREHGGHVDRGALAAYETARREPLCVRYRDHRIFTNPVPSCGGALIAYALRLLDTLREEGWHERDSAYPIDLARVMAATNVQRRQSRIQLAADEESVVRLLNDEAIGGLAESIRENPLTRRGTTHLNVVDRDGNIAAATVSNGEGCGYILPGTGIHLNNFLGEEDLAPDGLSVWIRGRRMSSMMAPTLVRTRDGVEYALGSGGSNRLRTAIVQVLMNLLEFDRTLEQAVLAPRMHVEHQLLSVEPGIDEAAIEALSALFPNPVLFSDLNLFFGGVHVACRDGERLEGMGDPRRGGVARPV